MVEAVLRDPELDARLEQDGYAVVPLLDADQVAELLAAYEEHVGAIDPSGGMAFDYMQDDRTAMRRVTELMRPFWDEHLPRVFADHRMVFSTFVHKLPGPESGMFLHDDRTFVDEERHRAHTIWISLVDASPEIGNGCLHVVPGSHRIMPAASGSGTPDWIRPYEAYLLRFARPVPTRAGEAIVYDSKALHSSPPNRTDRPRPAIATAVAPRSARLVHVVADGGRRTVYEVDPAFFVDVHPHTVERDGMPPGYEVVDEYEEPRADADPLAVAAACDPQDVPVPQDPALATGAGEAAPPEQAAPPTSEAPAPGSPGLGAKVRRRLARALR